MSMLSRRALIGAGAATGALSLIGAAPALADQKVNPRTSGTPFGDLTVVTDNGLLALPAGFAATRISTIGGEALLDDRGGRVIGVTPSNLDGTGCFEVGNRLRLVRNHECRANASVPVPLADGTVYDAGVPHGMGGNTIVETTRDGVFVQQWVGLSGTIRNCAGGETPWGSWLACEEDTTKKGTSVVSSVDGLTYITEKDHGYVFEVFPDRASKQIPEPIKAWGRGVWEGAAIGPKRTDAYLTEDVGGGLLYRWLAPAGTVIKPGIARRFGANDGVLQAAQLVKKGTPLVHYGELTASDLGKAHPVNWVDGGADRQAQLTDLRKQFPGATVHPKIEGCWSDGKGLWFTLSFVSATEAGKYRIGQNWGMVMFYDYADETLILKEYWPAGNSRGAVVPGHATETIKQFHAPDNVTVSPFGTLMLTEDGDNPCSLISWTPGSGSQEFARDLGDRGEWAGPCFSKRGDLLFASVQADCTYAITGPFKSFLNRR